MGGIPHDKYTCNTDVPNLAFVTRNVWARGGGRPFIGLIERPAARGRAGAAVGYLCFIDQKPVHGELYDLEADPGETRNLAGEARRQDVLERLRARWRECVKTLT